MPSGEGLLYLAVVLDVFSHRIVGWSMLNHLYTELMLWALDMALAQRHPDGVIHHSDQGRPVRLDRIRAALLRGQGASVRWGQWGLFR